jgi:uncharacterized protein with PQ loop repeat
MIDINLTTLTILSRSLFLWLLDSYLNSILAMRMGDGQKRAYFIPLYGYYRFGVLTGLPAVWVILALVGSVLAPLWIYIDATFSYVNLLLSIVGNASIIGLAANKLDKSKVVYGGGVIICGLVGQFLDLFTMLIAYQSLSTASLFYLLPLVSVFVQLPKIILVLKSFKASEKHEVNPSTQS